MRKLHRKLAFVTLILLGASVALVQGNSGSGATPRRQKSEGRRRLWLCLPGHEVVLVYDRGQDGRSVRVRHRGRTAIDGGCSR